MGNEVTVTLTLDADKIKNSYIRNNPLLNELLEVTGFYGIYFGPERMVFLLQTNAGWDFCRGSIEMIFYAYFGCAMEHLYRTVLGELSG